VTFTNKAAGEMKQRVIKDLGARARNMWVSTFHSSFARILREHAKLLKFTPQFAIYDANDTLSALKRVFKRTGVDPKIIDPKTVRSQIDRAKNNYQFPEDIRNQGHLR